MSDTSFYKEPLRLIIEGSNSPILDESELQFLREIGDGAAGSFLAEIYESASNDYQKSRCISGIMTLQGFDRISFLSNIFEKSDSSWQWAIVKRLGDIPDIKAVEKLIQVAINNPDPDVRYTAVVQIGNYGSGDVVSALQRIAEADLGEDYEGFRISDAAKSSIDKILKRSFQR